MNTYHLLTEDEHHEDLASHLKATERDHALHVTNKARYELMLQSDLSPAFRQRIEHLLAETTERLGEVEAILNAMRAQMPAPVVMKAAIQRMEMKQARP